MGSGPPPTAHLDSLGPKQALLKPCASIPRSDFTESCYANIRVKYGGRILNNDFTSVVNYEMHFVVRWCLLLTYLRLHV